MPFTFKTNLKIPSEPPEPTWGISCRVGAMAACSAALARQRLVWAVWRH